jgi:hypothetical protein
VRADAKRLESGVTRAAAMASLIYSSFFHDLAVGSIDLANGDVHVMLVLNYRANAGHTQRSDVTGEIVGEFAVYPVVEADAIVLPGVTLERVTLRASGAVYHAAGRLICYVDFGRVEISQDAAWVLSDSTISVISQEQPHAPLDAPIRRDGLILRGPARLSPEAERKLADEVVDFRRLGQLHDGAEIFFNDKGWITRIVEERA